MDFHPVPRKKSLRNFKKNEVGQWESIMYNNIEQQNVAAHSRTRI